MALPNPKKLLQPRRNPPIPSHRTCSAFPALTQMGAGVSDDLRVPWGWHEVFLFVVLGIIGSVVVTRGMAEAAVRLFGVNPADIFGATMTTAKSVVVLLSQALLDGGAILYLYLMILGRTPAPFWRTIGWRGLSSGAGSFRATASQFLSGGAVLALWFHSRARF